MNGPNTSQLDQERLHDVVLIDDCTDDEHQAQQAEAVMPS